MQDLQYPYCASCANGDFLRTRKGSTMARKPAVEAVDTTPDTEPTDAQIVADLDTEAEADESTITPSEAASVAALENTKATAVTIAEADFTAFDEAVEAVLAPHRAVEAAGDESDGKPDEALVPAVVEAYQALEGAANKRAARTKLSKIQSESMDDDKFFTAKCAMLLGDSLTSAKAAKAAKEPKAPANPTQAFVEHIAALNLAFQYAAAKPPVGVDANWAETYDALVKGENKAQVDSLVGLTEEDAMPEVSDLVALAVKIGTAKKAKSAKAPGTSSPRVGIYSGPPRSIVKHIRETFAGQPVGTFLKIGEISKFESSDYGTDHPSAGAISGQVKGPKFTDLYPGLQAEMEPVKGVRKIA